MENIKKTAQKADWGEPWPAFLRCYKNWKTHLEKEWLQVSRKLSPIDTGAKAGLQSLGRIRIGQGKISLRQASAFKVRGKPT